MDVKRTFFITEEEARDLRESLKDPYISHSFPCYELKNGQIVYPRHGHPAAGETWYDVVPF